MFSSLTVQQKLILATLGIVWAGFIPLVLRNLSEFSREELADSYFFWRRWQQPQNDRVKDWLNQSSGGGHVPGAPGKISRAEAVIAWTAFVGMIAALLVFDWTRH
jgi:hypothetical protein